tara:strand:+ start:683 stop:1261 length:579 start_codon:yes stop_codon:yes gene_type:complete
MTTLFLTAYPLRAAALTLLVLAIANWVVEPHKLLIWCGILIAISVGCLLGAKFGRGDSQGARSIRASLFGASLILSGALAIALGNALGLLGSIASDRLFGVMLGLTLIVTGNFLPKTVRPLTRQRCDTARLQRIERYAGWILVLAGLVHVAVWIFAPAESANLAAMMVVAAALCLIAALWMLMSRPAANPHA